LEKLAGADAFRSIGLDRRKALWEVSTKDWPVAMFLGKLTTTLTLAYPDEKSILSGLTKRSQPKEVAQENIFPGARNFK
jgi:hypothetical protein